MGIAGEVDMVRPISGHQGAAPMCPRKEVSLGCFRCFLLTRPLLVMAVAGQVMHDTVLNLKVRPHGRGRHMLQRRAKTQ